MKLIALALALVSFNAFAVSVINCRENVNGGTQNYKIYLENGVPTEMNVPEGVFPVKLAYDYDFRIVYVSTETNEETYEFSYGMDQLLTENRFFAVTLTTYSGGPRAILCRFYQ